MSAETTGADWAPSEIDTVRRALEHGQDRLDVGPVPWTRLPQRRPFLVAHRWPAIAALAGGAALVVLAVWLFGAGRTVADRSVQPAVDGVVGTLATDRQFLTDVRRLPVPESVGVGIDRDDVQVLVATDWGDSRLVLVAAGDARWWREGQKGAAAEQLVAVNRCTETDFCWTTYGPAIELDPSVPVEQGVLVYAPSDDTIRVRGSADVSPAGVVTRENVPVTERWAGLFAARLPSADGRVDLEVEHPGAAGAGTSAYTGIPEANDDWWARATAGIRAKGPEFAPGDPFLLHSAIYASQLLPGKDPRVLFWKKTDVDEQAVFAFHGRSGGWMLVAARRDPRAAEATVLAVSPRPAGDPSTFALAWTDPARGEVSLLGPAGSTSVAVGTGAGQFDLPLTDRMAAARLTGVTQARFGTPSGPVPATATVEPPYEGQTVQRGDVTPGG